MHNDAKALVDLARKESDPAMKRTIVERLTMMHSKEATDYMMELLK
jgi:phenylpyruvate tautomerase PptA (4-oxalocrotonate tautomerase family)